MALTVPYGVADYAQNIAVASLLAAPEKADDTAIGLASSLVVAKFALLAVPLIVIAVFWLKGQNRR